MANIKLINEKNSKLDLSSVKDANGEMLILQPKGTKDSQRECHEEVLEHPHVVSFIQAKWLRYEEVSLKPIETKTPAVTPAVPPAPVEPPAPPVVDPAPAPADAATTEPLVDDAPAAEETPANDLPSVVTSSEAMDIGESLSTSVSSGGKKKHRRD